jgi:uncharacterized protein (TIGR00266 family)
MVFLQQITFLTRSLRVLRFRYFRSAIDALPNTELSVMQYFIENQPAFPILRIEFQNGETFKAEAGAMVAMSENLTLEAKSSGKGFFGTIMAAVGGESLFASLFTASGPAELILAPPGPGDLVQLNLNNQTIYAQSGAYLAGHPDLTLSTKGSLKALISGEGLFLSKISGSGPLFLNSFGAIIERTITPGTTYTIDNGHLVAFEEGVDYRLKRASKGIFSMFATQEGLACEFSGSGKVWIQTRNLSPFATMLSRFLPSSSGKSSE